MNIENDLLYKNLIFLDKYRPPYNVKEIFQFMLGYQLSSNEEWISNFNLFLEKKLLNLYTDNQFDKLPVNCGEFIYLNQKSDSEGLDLFFKFLREYKDFTGAEHLPRSRRAVLEKTTTARAGLRPE